MKIRHIFALLYIATTLTACAGGPKVRLSDELHESIKTVALSSDIPVPSKVYYNGARQNVTANFGLIGSFIGNSDKKHKEADIKTTMEQQNIDVSGIVYKAFAQEMALRTPYKPLQGDAAADARLSMEVHLYGLQAAGIGSHLYPALTVSAQMKDADGKVIWRNRAVAGGLTQKNNPAKYTYDELMAKPARITEVMTQAAQLVASEAMVDL